LYAVGEAKLDPLAGEALVSFQILACWSEAFHSQLTATANGALDAIKTISLII
jgi:hypothetical protein